MGDDWSSQMGLQQRSAEMMLNCPSSGMNTRPMIMHQLYGSGWDPQAELSKSSSYPTLVESHGVSCSPHLVKYPSDTNLALCLPKLPLFGSENFHEHLNPFGLSRVSHNLTDPQNYAEERSLPNSRRKRDSEPNSPNNKTADPHTDNSSQASGLKDHDDNRLNTSETTVANSSGKSGGKQVNDKSQGEEGAKQNYIHMRARRGQATNSHSLAERVRREKINERMRLLQELVPGCNKITGKAVMLDEIINYVQSLQQQVEFLSMKLATFNPEVIFDVERLLSKDILHSRGGGTPVTGFDQGMISSHAFTPGFYQTFSSMPIAASQYHHMSQGVLDGDLQSLLQMGFYSSAAVRGLGPNGNSKNEL